MSAYSDGYKAGMMRPQTVSISHPTAGSSEFNKGYMSSLHRFWRSCPYGGWERVLHGEEAEVLDELRRRFKLLEFRFDDGNGDNAEKPFTLTHEGQIESFHFVWDMEARAEELYQQMGMRPGK